MRILHVILSEGFKGSERSAAEYCNYLANAGHDVSVAIGGGWSWRRLVGRGGARGTIADHVDSRVTVLRIPRRWFARRRLEKIVAERAPDIVHTHLNRAVRLVAGLEAQVATVGTLHMHRFDQAYLGLDAIFCVARWQRRLIPADFAGQVFYTPNIVRPNRKLTDAERAALRRELGIGESDFVIGGLGQLIERKGWDVLIRAFRQAALANARLVILGDGNQRAALAALGGDQVLLPGFRNNAKDYLQIMDLFVCPSREEAFGLVLAEALDAQVPVIASRTEGCCEILDNFPGRIFPADDADALADLLVEHYRSRPCGAQGGLGEFLPDNAGATLVKAYESVLANRAARQLRPADSAT